MTEENCYWDILDEIPDGWSIDKSFWSGPLPNTVYITNGYSPISGKCKRAVLRIKPKPTVDKQDEPNISIVKSAQVVEPVPNIEPPYEFPAKELNILCRAKMKRKLLADIQVDLMVCELEGYDKREYINDLKKLINGFKFNSKKVKKSENNQYILDL